MYKKLGMNLPTFNMGPDDDSESDSESDDLVSEVNNKTPPRSPKIFKPTLTDAAENLTGNIVAPQSQQAFINSLTKLDSVATDITQAQWGEIKRLGEFISTKQKRQFARYSTHKDVTFSCPLAYWRSPLGAPIFYKVFKYGEATVDNLPRRDEDIVIEPENIIIAKILAEIEYQQQAYDASSKCIGEASFTVPQIFAFGKIKDSDPIKQSYYIAMEYLSTSSPSITSLRDILMDKRVSAARDCHNIVTKVKAASKCLMSQNIWHNDLLNPDNILIQTKNGKMKLIIIDFGEAAGMEGTSTHIFGPKVPSCKGMQGFPRVTRAADTIASTAKGRSTRRAIAYTLGASARASARRELEEHYNKLGGRTRRTKKRKPKRKSKTRRRKKSKRKRTRKL